MTLKKLRGEVNLFSSTRERFDCFEDKFALFYSIFDQRITVLCTVWMLSAPNAFALTLIVKCWEDNFYENRSVNYWNSLCDIPVVIFLSPCPNEILLQNLFIFVWIWFRIQFVGYSSFWISALSSWKFYEYFMLPLLWKYTSPSCLWIRIQFVCSAHRFQ